MLEKPVARAFRTFTLPESLKPSLEAAFELTLDSKTLRLIAHDILKMSNFYIQNPNGRTPWSELWCQRAQGFYFLPLNYIRNRAVFLEGERFGFFKDVMTAMDVGSGLGAVKLASESRDIEWRALEISEIAQSLSRKINPDLKFSSEIKKSDLVTFSYSLTEEIALNEILNKTDRLLITEPALRDDSRKVQHLRQKLIDQGWHIWAPCTHEQSCPLLISESDWCHDRVHFSAPEWFLELENHLPIKNLNLAHSYLLASRQPAPRIPRAARTVGDFIEEKGKSKVLICRSAEKENLTWLHRHLEPEEISRGALVRLPEIQVQKSREIRLSDDLEIIL